MAEPKIVEQTGVARATTPRSMRTPREIRPDLEGLRGVAVAGVLLFHLGAPWAAGGFVGVDAFFVLSGFLITGLLLREHERTGRVSLPAFYARRVRRILPAALVTIVVTVGVSALVLAPLDVPEITLDGAAAALSVGNIRFALGATDYFGSTIPSPFRHFWSLGVEEQFYLVWPALMIGGLWLTRSTRRVGWVIAAVVALSLAGSIWLTGVDQPWAFYSLPTRAWQLGLGGLLAATAAWFARRSSLVLAPVATAGLVALVMSFALLDGAMAYPGAAALLPTLATAAVIMGGERPGPAAWALGFPPLRWLGRISYSLYLWHWPLLILPVLALGRELSLEERLTLGLMSIAVAALSWRWIEEPIRRGWSPTAPRLRTVAVGVAAMALVAVFATGAGDWTLARLDAAATEPGDAGRASDVAGGQTAAVDADAAAPAADDIGGDVDASPQGLAASSSPTPGSSARPAVRLDVDDPTIGVVGLLGPATPAPDAGSGVATGSDAVDAAPAAPATAAAPATPAVTPEPAAAASGRIPLPSDVQPKLTKARKDSEPIVRDGCSLSLGGSKPPVCWYGKKDADVTVALVGDSHAAHWFPALEVLAKDRGWRLVPMTKHSCTFVDLRIYSSRLKREYTECEAWRRNVVTALQKIEPDMVVVSSHRWFPTMVAADQDATRQGKAMARLLEQLPGEIVLLADTPISRYDVPACLSRNLQDIRKCTSDRAYAFGKKPGVREKVAANLTGATLIDLSAVICPTTGRCPVVVDKMIVYRDDHHLTATFSRALAPALAERLPTLKAADCRQAPEGCHASPEE
jgi:peptidoglycan/LPS O-acetylase OafA/YrhL